MATFTLAANPSVHPSVLFSGFRPGSIRLLNNNSYVVDGETESGAGATVSLHGTGFGADGAGLLNGAARVLAVEFTVGGQVMLRVDNASITGPKLLAWLDGDGAAFEDAVFAGADVMVLSNLPEYADGRGGADRMDGRGGADVLLGSGGDDTLAGGDGDDTLEGGADDDLVVGGAGSDWAEGGAGTDTFLAEGALRRQARIEFFSAGEAVSGPGAQDEDVLIGFERIAFLDGTLHMDPADTAGQVWRLYGAAFGRGAETTGLTHWVEALDSGAIALAAAAGAFVGSAEFAGRYGQLDDAGFVTRLYANVLGRAPDAEGLQAWTAQLAKGVSRAELLLGFSESAEYRAAVDTGIADRLWTVDRGAMDVLRCYVAVLDRLPDAGGLAHWTEFQKDEPTDDMMVWHFVASEEFQTRFGGLSNKDFVSRLYLTALDRPADEQGLADWTRMLDTYALLRHEVVQEFAHSNEMTQKLLPLVADGIAFA